jgi:lipid-A-disaccharide synthase-like uncharacterized protein
LNEADITSLTKANKTALKAIADFIKAEKTWLIVGALPLHLFMVQYIYENKKHSSNCPWCYR